MYLYSDEWGKISSTPPQISFLDHGFLFGDSIYEVVRLYDGKFFGKDAHLKRLSLSAARLGYPLESYLPVIEDRIKDLFQNLKEPNACLRLVVTRGEGKIHIDPSSCKSLKIYMAAWKYEAAMSPASVRVYVPQVERNNRLAMDPAIKSGNYLNNVMALTEAISAGYDDALMLNHRAEVTELTTSNIAWIKNSKIYTPAADAGILLGITRQYLMDCLEVREGLYSLDELLDADEVFALSTLKEVVPVSEVASFLQKSKKYEKFDQSLLIRQKLRHTIEEELTKQERIL